MLHLLTILSKEDKIVDNTLNFILPVVLISMMPVMKEHLCRVCQMYILQFLHVSLTRTNKISNLITPVLQHSTNSKSQMVNEMMHLFPVSN